MKRLISVLLILVMLTYGISSTAAAEGILVAGLFDSIGDFFSDAAENIGNIASDVLDDVSDTNLILKTYQQSTAYK